MQRQRKTKKTKSTERQGRHLQCVLEFFRDPSRLTHSSALPRTHVVSVISNPGFLSNCLSCTSGTINAGQRTFSFNLRLVSDWESEGGIALTDVYHTDCQWLQCELTSFEKSARKQNYCHTGWGAARRGVHRHVEQLLRRRRGLSSFVTWSMLYSKTASWMSCLSTTLMSSYSSLSFLQIFISMGDDDLCNLVSMMPRALSMSMWMWMWSGVARHRLLPQEVVRLWGFRQADGLRKADQPWARPENLDPGLFICLSIFVPTLYGFASFPINSIQWKYWRFCENIGKLDQLLSKRGPRAGDFDKSEKSLQIFSQSFQTSTRCGDRA